MNFDILKLIATGGTPVVLVAITVIFLREMRKLREEFLNTIENHIDHNTNVLHDLHLFLKAKLDRD